MTDVFLGRDLETNRSFYLPGEAFKTHLHLIGGTGKGKTTALHTLLHPLLRNPREKAAFFIVDRLGNLSWELLLWFSSRYCPDSVRERLIYLEPAREDIVMGFNPLLYETPQHGYYKVSRATEIILRGWESVNIEAMPRLARWTFNTFYAAAQLGLTIADCGHFLLPGSALHQPLLSCLPPLLRAEWEEISTARNGEAMRILESSRNRIKPWVEAPVLRHMFGATTGTLDVLRFMREGKIVLINLAPRNRLSEQLGDAIGALILNEVLTTARSLPLGVRYPTYLLLDEFQNFVGPDLEKALPEVRQLGIRLLLSHQSLSQLKRGEYDLTNMIFQAQTRLAFGIQGEDADLLGHEYASLSFDPRRVKHTIMGTRQRIAGYELQLLRSWSDSQGDAESWNKSFGQNWTDSENRVYHENRVLPIRSEGESSGKSEQQSSGKSHTSSSTTGRSEHLVPIHQEVREVSNVSFYSGDDWDRVWASDLRTLPTGTALVRLVDDSQIHRIAVENSAFGYFSWDHATLRRKLPRVLDCVEQLLAKNFQSEFFVSPAQIERETQLRLARVLEHSPEIGYTGSNDEPSPPQTSNPVFT